MINNLIIIYVIISYVLCLYLIINTLYNNEELFNKYSKKLIIIESIIIFLFSPFVILLFIISFLKDIISIKEN